MESKYRQGRSVKVTAPIYRQVQQVSKVLDIYARYEDKVNTKNIIDLLNQLHELLDVAGTICINDAERHEALSESEAPDVSLGQAELPPSNEDTLITYTLSADVFDNIELDQGIDMEEDEED